MSEFEDDIPPTVACARCGRVDCAGCEPEPLASAPSHDFIWETRAHSELKRLFAAAEQTALEPDLVFGRLRKGGLATAFRFAFFAEMLALASFALFALALSFSFFPVFTRALLATPRLLATGTILWLGGSFIVVAIHVLWGLSLEWGLATTPTRSDYNRSLRFGLYSCGWDLLTSPAGVAHALWAAPRSLHLGAVVQATRVLRRALDAYLVDCRALDEFTRRRAWLGSLFVFGAGFVVLLLASVFGFVYWIRSQLA